jgi:3-hydroxyacyl-[acyl-carrier-protein] dehydratase
MEPLMHKEEIKNILHQREPYLMVDQVHSIDEKSIHTSKTHAGNEPHVLGHFPGAPVVPGAMLQEICTQSAGILITQFYSPVKNYNSNTTKGWALGVLNKVEFAKYLEMVKPNQPIEAKVELIEHQDGLFKFRAQVYQQQKLKAKLKFNLVNISDKYLY